MNPRDEIGFWLHRDEILKQLFEWGYNTSLMSVWDVDETGYWRYVRKDKYLMLNEEGTEPIRHREKWLKLEHYVWLANTVSNIKKSHSAEEN